MPLARQVGLVFQMVKQVLIALPFSNMSAIVVVGVGDLGIVTFSAIRKSGA